jgi:hypothetical protein
MVHLGINFGSNITEMSIGEYALQDINLFSKNMGNDYMAERVNWDIQRNDDTEIIVFRLYSNDKTMYQYCAFIKSTVKKYIIAYIQLNTESNLNELFINDFKRFLATIEIYEENTLRRQ